MTKEQWDHDELMFHGASGVSPRPYPQIVRNYNNNYSNNNYKKSNMAYNNQGPRISQDRFGNPFQLKFAKIAINKKEGNTVDGCFGAYFELGGKLYKVEVSPANKQDKHGNDGVWLKVTAKAKRSQSARSM